MLCEMSASASRRDDSDRKPGTKCLAKRPSKEPSRRVRYDRAQRNPEVFLVDLCARVSVSVFLFETSSLQSSNRCAYLHESDRTLRDGSFGWRAVPGTSCQATIAPSLRDAFSPAPLGHNPKSLSAFVERSDLLILTKS
jgi:hypothetical protein